MHRPSTAATDLARTQQLLRPRRIPDVKSVLVMLQQWESQITEFAAQSGEEVMNENTRRELMVSMMPSMVVSMKVSMIVSMMVSMMVCW